MLALVLLPTLGKAMAFGAGSTAWAEVCTPQGVRVVALDAAGGEATEQAGAPASAHLEHCALCLLSAQPLMLPPAGAALPASEGVPTLPRLYLPAQGTPHAWRSAWPRGPPGRV